MKTVLYMIFILFLSINIFADFKTKCVGIIDGDTIEILEDGKVVLVRLDAVDCPELEQDFGRKAKKFTEDFVFNQEIFVKGDKKDRKGRIIAKIYNNNKELNLELLKEGLAWHYKKYNSEEVYADEEQKAREELAGLWGMNNPIAPWKFRKDSLDDNIMAVDNNKEIAAQEEIATVEIEKKSAEGATEQDFKEEHKNKTVKLINSNNRTVYVVPAGRFFHRKDCPKVGGAKTAIYYKHAVFKGYHPCKECNP